jgi:asparagine synthase (glutamine-hydrolysing)
MCGIAGVVGQADTDRAPVMRRMRDAVAHRGPDSAGERCDAHSALGVRRLRIIDLVTGDQPQCGEEERVWTVFNGEIYNFHELRDELSKEGHTFRTRSDTEVIVHLYERDGEAFVEKLDGMFALAVWDTSQRTLVLARDRLGKKPVLTYESDGELYFASEHQALIAGLGTDRFSVDRAAIALYLRLGYVPAPFDAFAGVNKLEAATVLVWRDGTTTRRRYWEPPTAVVPVGEDEAIARVRTLFDAAVRKRLVADVPVGAFLSGGIDSSALVASMAAQSKTVRTFTIGFEEEGYSEVEHARRIAQRFSTDHHEFVVRPDMTSVVPLLVRHYGEPYADSSAIPTYYLSKLTRDFVTVALAGDGGDELFAGYQRYHAVRLAAALDRIPAALRRPILRGAEAILPKAGDQRGRSGRLRRFISGARRPRAGRYLSWLAISDDEWLSTSATDDFRPYAEAAARELERRAGLPIGDPTRRAQLLDVALYLPDDLLVKVDIASMANSLEVRAPFLDRCLVEYALALPPSLMIRGTRRKWILRKAFAETLPPENLARRKQGFGVPIGRWLRQELRPLLSDVVLSTSALERGYLRPEAVKVMVDEHLGGVDHSHRLWSLLMLELWHREFSIA